MCEYIQWIHERAGTEPESIHHRGRWGITGNSRNEMQILNRPTYLPDPYSEIKEQGSWIPPVYFFIPPHVFFLRFIPLCHSFVPEIPLARSGHLLDAIT